MLKLQKRGENGASQTEWGRGGEREGKTPARKHCENEKHPLISQAWPLFRKWVADQLRPKNYRVNSCAAKSPSMESSTSAAKGKSRKSLSFSLLEKIKEPTSLI